MKPLFVSDFTFDQIFEGYKNRIYGYALSICKSPYAAEEITQEIFIKLWLCRENFHQVTNVDGYIFKIVRNSTLNYLRKVACDEKLMKELMTHMIPEENNVENALIISDYNLLLQDALDKLSPQRRLVYELSRKNGLSYEEIADHLSLSKNTVKNHLVSALSFIRSYLSQYGVQVAMIIMVILLIA